MNRFPSPHNDFQWKTQERVHLYLFFSFLFPGQKELQAAVAGQRARSAIVYNMRWLVSMATGAGITENRNNGLVFFFGAG